MKSFSCSQCQQLLFFENIACTRCGRALAYLPDRFSVSPLEPAEPARQDASSSLLVALPSEAPGHRYRLCRNYTDHATCNWAIPEHDDNPFCVACRLNDVIPDLSDPQAAAAWQRLEAAKRRLIYTLLALRLPLESRKERPVGGLAFSFMKDDPNGSGKVLTGHRDGVITINIAEADDPFREKTRTRLGEAYRTLVGHFRHEIGHYYWDRLVKDSQPLAGFHDLFGDEQADYAEASRAHYERGAPPEWASQFVTAYASMHPWEDWAETFAHYLHMVDTLDTARSFGLALRAKPIVNAGLASLSAQRLDFDDFDDLISAWFPLTLALNSFNRGMGIPDLYPFVLSPKTTAKLAFVHGVIERAARAS